MNKRSGFTLIELMIVVLIISVIAAIAIPNLLRSRASANEAAAIEELSVITSAQVSYSTANNAYGDFDALTDDTTGPPFIDDSWVQGRTKYGYQFTLNNISAADFECNSDPIEAGVSGVRHFFVNGTGVIRQNVGAAADAASDPVGQ